MTARSSTVNATAPAEILELFKGGYMSTAEAISALEGVFSGSAQGSLGCGVIEFEYCNWEGRKSLREARPISVRFGKSEWHPKPQWLMRAFDVHRGEEREFAMADMAFEDDVLAALAFPSTDRSTPESSR